MKSFIKENWFKIIITLALLMIAISVAYYFFVFLPKKENMIEVQKQQQVIQSKQQTQKQEVKQKEGLSNFELYGGEVMQVGGEGSMIHQVEAYTIGEYGIQLSSPEDWVSVGFNSRAYLMDVNCKDGYKVYRCFINGVESNNDIDDVLGCRAELKERIKNKVNIVCVIDSKDLDKTTYNQVVDSKKESPVSIDFYNTKLDGKVVEWKAKISDYYSQITGIKFCVIDKDHQDVDIDKPCDWFWASSADTMNADNIKINPKWGGDWVDYILRYYRVPFNKNSRYYNETYTIKGMVDGLDCGVDTKCVPRIEIIGITK